MFSQASTEVGSAGMDSDKLLDPLLQKRLVEIVQGALVNKNTQNIPARREVHFEV